MIGGTQGLGTMYKVASDGTVIDCDSWSNLLQGPCWNPAAPTVAVTADGTGRVNALNQSDVTPTCNQTFMSGVCDSFLIIGAVGALAILLMIKR